ELLLEPLADEGLQLAERDLDLAHVEDEIAAIGAIAPRVGHAERAPAAASSDADPRRVRAAGAEGARAAAADPPVAALVPLSLLREALLEEAPKLGRIEGLEHGALLFGEIGELRRIAEPALDLVGHDEARGLDPREGGAEGLVEGVELRLRVHE